MNRGRRRPGTEGEIEITALADDGRAVGHLEGKVVFVAGALPGERVRVAFERTRRHFDHARVVEVLAASPDRVEPPCRHFGVCGGCSLQHLRPEAQVAAKQHLLEEKFERFGRIRPETWLAPLAGESLHYRRSARLGVRDVPKKGGIIIGFRERRSHFLTPLDACPVLDVRASSRLPALREAVSRLSCRGRVPQIEVACGDEECAFVLRHLVPLTEADRDVLREFGRSEGVRIYTQAGGPATVKSLWPEAETPLFYDLPAFGLRLGFRPTDFIQVNAEMNRALVSRAVELLAPGDGEEVLDLFCGLGNFTLAIARRAPGARVTGLEADERLVEAARENARRGGIENAAFEAADLYDPAGVARVWERFQPGKLLIDPPRSGAIEVLKAMPEGGLPERIVYVSCNAATLARDAELLVNARGFRLKAAGVVDMFPNTSHIESVVLFVRDGR